MRIVRQTERASAAYPKGAAGAVVTIGNFDGMHLGHQAMLALAREAADERGLPLVVISFDPLPEAHFLKQKAPLRVMGTSDRVLAFSGFGVDVLCLLPFSSKLASMTADAFVAELLAHDLRCQHVVVGDDFAYGQGRQGDFHSLKAAGRTHGFSVARLDSVTDATGRISSTRLRAALAEGDFEACKAMLGRAYRISGRVVHGDARGRLLGFPTLNFNIRHPRPLSGVFAVRVQFDGDAVHHNGVANLGVRPTVGGEKRLLEVHLLDFDREVYGQRACVDFGERIRAEKKFASFDALKAQIEADKAAALRWFSAPQQAAF